MQQDEDGTLTIQLVPPTPIGGFGITYTMTNRFGGISGLVIKSMSSGICNGESGIVMLNSGTGQFQVNLFASEVSGLQLGTYTYKIQRTDSGNASDLVEGFRIMGI